MSSPEMKFVLAKWIHEMVDFWQERRKSVSSGASKHHSVVSAIYRVLYWLYILQFLMYVSVKGPLIYPSLHALKQPHITED